MFSVFLNLCFPKQLKVLKNGIIKYIFLFNWLSLFGTQSICDFLGSSDGKEPARNESNTGSTPGSGRSPGEGNGSPLQYSCLENPMDRGAWWTTVHGVTESQTGLSNFHLVQLAKVFSDVLMLLQHASILYFNIIFYYTFYITLYLIVQKPMGTCLPFGLLQIMLL